MNFSLISEMVWSNPFNVEVLQKMAKQIVDARNLHGDSLLHIAAAEGNENVVKSLLQLGCNPNVQNEFGSPPIDYAAWKENKQIVKLLLNAGADIGLSDCNGNNVIDNLHKVGKSIFAEWILHQHPKPCDGL